MKTRIILVSPLILLLVLSLLPLFLLNLENYQREKVSEEQTRSEWRREAMDLVEFIRSENSFPTQMNRLNHDFKTSLMGMIQKSGSNSPELTARLLYSAYLAGFPRTHRPTDPIIYGFAVDRSGNPTMLNGPGLRTQKKQVITRLFSEFLKADTFPQDEMKRLDRNTRAVFGDLAPFQFLAIHRKGFLTPVQFEGKNALILWDTLEVERKPIGGYFLIIFPRETLKTLDQKGLRYALNQMAKNSGGDKFPILVPLSTSMREIKTIIPGVVARRRDIRKFLASIPRIKNREEFAPCGKLSLKDDIWILRQLISVNIPYEIWIVSTSGRKKHEAKPLEFLLLASIGFAWTGILLRVSLMGKPLQISMRNWFFGFFLILGFLPLMALFLAGSLQAESTKSRKIQDTINRAIDDFEEIDSNSSLIFNRFVEACHVLSASPTWMASISNPDRAKVKEGLNSIRRYFDHQNVALPDFLLYPAQATSSANKFVGELTERDKGILEFYAPLMLEGMKVLDPTSNPVIPQAKGERAILMKAIYGGGFTGDDLGVEHVSRRGDGDSVEFNDEQIFQYYDFLGEKGKISAAYLFRVPMAKVHSRYLIDCLFSLGRAQRNNSYAFGKIVSGGFSARFPHSTSSLWNSVETKNLRLALNNSAKTGSQRVIHEPETKSIVIAFPCLKSKGFLLGARIDLSEIYREAEDKKDLLIAGTLLLALAIFFLGTTFTAFLLNPVSNMEQGLLKIASGDLTIKVGLPREDELGEMTKKLDSMVEGLKKRRELGGYVSGTLNRELTSKSLEIIEGTSEKFAAILVSDLRGFTTISESHPVREVVAMLNDHLKRMSEKILAQNGFIDKFIGDAIVAVFLHESPMLAVNNSILAALEMIREHETLQTEREKSGDFPFAMGVGIDFGPVLVGTLKSRGRSEWTVIGPARTNAEQLEALSKLGSHTKIIVSNAIAKSVSDHVFEKLPERDGYELLIPENRS